MEASESLQPQQQQQQQQTVCHTRNNFRIAFGDTNISVVVLKHQGEGGRHKKKKDHYYFQARIRSKEVKGHLWAGWATKDQARRDILEELRLKHPKIACEMSTYGEISECSANSPPSSPPRQYRQLKREAKLSFRSNPQMTNELINPHRNSAFKAVKAVNALLSLKQDTDMLNLSSSSSNINKPTEVVITIPKPHKPTLFHSIHGNDDETTLSRNFLEHVQQVFQYDTESSSSSSSSHQPHSPLKKNFFDVVLNS